MGVCAVPRALLRMGVCAVPRALSRMGVCAVPRALLRMGVCAVPRALSRMGVCAVPRALLRMGVVQSLEHSYEWEFVQSLEHSYEWEFVQSLEHSRMGVCAVLPSRCTSCLSFNETKIHHNFFSAFMTRFWRIYRNKMPGGAGGALPPHFFQKVACLIILPELISGLGAQAPPLGMSFRRPCVFLFVS